MEKGKEGKRKKDEEEEESSDQGIEAKFRSVWKDFYFAWCSCSPVNRKLKFITSFQTVGSNLFKPGIEVSLLMTIAPQNQITTSGLWKNNTPKTKNKWQRSNYLTKNERINKNRKITTCTKCNVTKETYIYKEEHKMDAEKSEEEKKMPQKMLSISAQKQKKSRIPSLRYQSKKLYTTQ